MPGAVGGGSSEYREWRKDNGLPNNRDTLELWNKIKRLDLDFERSFESRLAQGGRAGYQTGGITETRNLPP